MQQINELFTKRFEPKSIRNWVIPQRIKDIFETPDGQAKTLTGNYLFYGTQGCGKSSLARYLSKSYRHLYINAAMSGKIDTLRSTIEEFVLTYQLVTSDEITSDRKVVILDEVGQTVSDSFWEGLKGFIDTYQDKVTFIMTTNHFTKVPDPIKSRCNCINFNTLNAEEEQLITKGYKDRLVAILRRLEIEFDDTSIERLYQKFFPDFRQTLVYLQQLSTAGVKTLDTQTLDTFELRFKDVYEMILNPKLTPEQIYREITQSYVPVAQEVIESIDSGFVPYLLAKDGYERYAPFIPDIVCLAADYSAKTKLTVDPALCLKALVLTINRLIFKQK